MGSIRSQLYRAEMRSRVVVGLLLLVLTASAAACGGGGGGEAAGGDVTTTTATTATGSDDAGPVDQDAPSGTDTKLCREVTSTASELNLAASNGDFAAVAKRWQELRAEFPADLQPTVDTVVEGYGKVAADPNQFSVLDTSPYKEALDAIHAHTGATC